MIAYQPQNAVILQVVNQMNKTFEFSITLKDSTYFLKVDVFYNARVDTNDKEITGFKLIEMPLQMVFSDDYDIKYNLYLSVTAWFKNKYNLTYDELNFADKKIPEIKDVCNIIYEYLEALNLCETP